MKVGFIGYGHFAAVRESILSKNLHVNLSGFYDPGWSERDTNLPRYDSLDTLFANSTAVIISVPPKLAPWYVVQSLKSGQHVFCEKPAAVLVEELLQIEPHLNSRQVLAYGFNHRQHPSIQKMKTIVQSKQLGQILWMRGRYGKEVDASYRDTWRCNKELNGGGILIDQGIHMVDLMSFLANGFDGAQAVLSDRFLGIPGVEDNGFITLFSRKSKISASIHSTITQWRYLFSLEVFCEQGSIILNGLRTNSGRYGDEKLSIKPNDLCEGLSEDVEYTYPENTSWQEEMDAFVDACLTGRRYPYARYEDAVATTRLIDLIYKNAEWI